MWNLANILTMARLGTLPVILLFIWPGFESRETSMWAAILYGLSGVVDIVDGAVARRTNTVTIIGKFLDPLADKLFYVVTLVALLQLPDPRIPAWMVMVIVVRELSITGLRSIAISEGVVIAAEQGGKFKTTFSTAGMCALLVHYPYMINFGFVTSLIHPHVIGMWITTISMFFSLTSGFGYIYRFTHATRKSPRLS
jgi:CDP-diacylglycerol---glycerol-3-phosphate 3-phosphatidyltransferase